MILAITSIFLAGLAYSLCLLLPFQHRSQMSLCSLIILALLPLFHWLPAESLPLPVSQLDSPLSSWSANATLPADKPWLAACWMILTILLATRHLLAHRKLANWRTISNPISPSSAIHETLVKCHDKLEINKSVPCFTHPHLQAPLIAGLLKPAIYLPAQASQWSSSQLEACLLHELAHFQRRDLWVKELSHWLCALLWFNPFVWKIKALYNETCEYACDQIAIQQGINRRDYLNALCDLTLAKQKTNSELVAAMSGHASLQQRALSIGSSKPPRKFLTALFSLCLFTSAVALNSLQQATNYDAPGTSEYTAEEIQLRLSANPFPADF